MTTSLGAHVTAIYDAATISKQHVLEISEAIVDRHYRQLRAADRDAIRAAFIIRDRGSALQPILFGSIFTTLGVAAGLNVSNPGGLVVVGILAVVTLTALIIGLVEHFRVRRAIAIHTWLEMVESRMTPRQLRRAERSGT